MELQMVEGSVIVIGASSGIGRAAALRFAEGGWRVGLLARRETELLKLLGELPGNGHFHLQGDYSHADTMDSLAAIVAEHWDGHVDALVNCAGVSIGGDPIASDLDEWRKPLDIMLDGAILTTRAVVPLMHGGGRIIHMTSIHGRRAERGSSAYGVAKAAIDHYCRSLALELADSGILVNAIAPGFVDTPMSSASGADELKSEWFIRDYVEGRHLPLRRAARPEEIASVAWFLAGPDSTYITGQVITVDGGLTVTF
jgi:NAD(P)-dependent dehydrogenase (short-subunit alcohol dehydrogenase family)